MMGDHLVRCDVVVEEMEADEEEAIVTRGLDFLKPYKSASNRWRMDAKASSSNNARIRSHSRRLLPSFAHTA